MECQEVFDRHSNMMLRYSALCASHTVREAPLCATGRLNNLSYRKSPFTHQNERFVLLEEEAPLHRHMRRDFTLRGVLHL